MDSPKRISPHPYVIQYPGNSDTNDGLVSKGDGPPLSAAAQTVSPQNRGVNGDSINGPKKRLSSPLITIGEDIFDNSPESIKARIKRRQNWFYRIDEVLTKSTKLDTYIHDFVHSTNPKFDGKSKKDRIRMALGAYSAKHQGSLHEALSRQQWAKIHGLIAGKMGKSEKSNHYQKGTDLYNIWNNARQSVSGGGTYEISESVEAKLPEFMDAMSEFVTFAAAYMDIKELPKIRLKETKVGNSFASWHPTEGIEVSVTNRNFMDCARSLAHEICHHKQHEMNVLHSESGQTGSEHENEANAVAGIIMRDFAKYRPEYFAISLHEAKNPMKDRYANKNEAKDKLHGFLTKKTKISGKDAKKMMKTLDIHHASAVGKALRSAGAEHDKQKMIDREVKKRAKSAPKAEAPLDAHWASLTARHEARKKSGYYDDPKNRAKLKAPETPRREISIGNGPKVNVDVTTTSTAKPDVKKHGLLKRIAARLTGRKLSEGLLVKGLKWALSPPPAAKKSASAKPAKQAPKTYSDEELIQQKARKIMINKRAKELAASATKDKEAEDTMASLRAHFHDPKREPDLKSYYDRQEANKPENQAARMSAFAAAQKKSTDDLNKYHEKHKLPKSIRETLALVKKAENSGIPFEVLEQVYDRGCRDWNPSRTNLTLEQHSFSRVNSFIAGGKAAVLDADLDLRPKIQEDTPDNSNPDLNKIADNIVNKKKNKAQTLQKPVPTTTTGDVSMSEEVLHEYKVGDTVKPTIGPHYGQPHKILHIHRDGTMNITPLGLTPRQNRYHLGAARCSVKDLEDRNEIAKEKEKEAAKKKKGK